MHERAEGANLDFRQRDPRSFVADEIGCFVEQVDEFLARGVALCTRNSPLVSDSSRSLARFRHSSARVPHDDLST